MTRLQSNNPLFSVNPARDRLPDVFADVDRYATPPGHRPSLIWRLSPSVYFYAKVFFGVVQRSAKKAREGTYDGDAWAQSSLEIVRILELMGSDIEVTGLRHVDALDTPAVYVGNHMSTLETFVLPAILRSRRKVTFVVKKSLIEYPWFGEILGARYPIVVGRENPREDLTTVLTEGKRLLSEGVSIIIFPQTTRTTRFDPAKFNSIGAKLAARAGVPLVPLALRSDCWSTGKYLKDFGPIYPNMPVRFSFGEPIAPEGKGEAAHKAAAAFIEEHLSRWYAEKPPVE